MEIIKILFIIKILYIYMCIDNIYNIAYLHIEYLLYYINIVVRALVR